ncbi:AAA family ATPase [Sphaerimonospora cavernae]|uniref:AAA family ATPase n=1 Tax=Sphaerimonospora cavernae TaxID=1740611 RepID=A0ABV6UA51_9ACTN
MAKHDREDPHLEDQLAWLDAIKEMPDEVEIAVSAVTSATLARPPQSAAPALDENAGKAGGQDGGQDGGQGTPQSGGPFGGQRAEQPPAEPESASPYPSDPWRLVPSDSPLTGALSGALSGPLFSGTASDGVYGAPTAADADKAQASEHDTGADATAAFGRGAFAYSPADTDSYSLGGLGAFGDLDAGEADKSHKSFSSDLSESPASASAESPGSSGFSGSSESADFEKEQPLRGWLEPAVPVDPPANATSADSPAKGDVGFGQFSSSAASSSPLSPTFPSPSASPGTESTPPFTSSEDRAPTPLDGRPLFTSGEFGTGEFGTGEHSPGKSETGEFETGEFAPGFGTGFDTGEVVKSPFLAGPSATEPTDHAESLGFSEDRPTGPFSTTGPLSTTGPFSTTGPVSSTGPLRAVPGAEAREPYGPGPAEREHAPYERDRDTADDWDRGASGNDRDRDPGAEREHEQHQRDRAASGEREPYQPRRRQAAANPPLGGTARGTGAGKPSADSLDPVNLLRGRRNAPRSGWRRFVYRASAGLIKPGEPAEVRRRRELMNRARTPVAGGHHRVAVLSLKGGVGKTTTTVGLGATLAQVRGDRVIAVDANPDRGTLSDKVELETAATVRDLLNERGQITRYVDIRAFTSQTPSRLEILASDRDPSVSEAFSADDYHTVAQVLENFYSICITDCGTGLLHSAMSGVLGMADQIVLVSSPSVDGARAASATLDWLEAHHYDDLVRSATVVLCSVRPRSKSTIDLDKLESHFAARCRAVIRVPYDPHLEEGAEIDLERLQESTRDAYLRLAASVGDGFAGVQALTQRRFSEIPDHL